MSVAKSKVFESKLGKAPAPTPSNQQAEEWYGSYQELGKTEARQMFLQLVDEVQEKDVSLAITDRGEKVAVIMGFKFYKALMAILKPIVEQPGKNPFAGTIKKVGSLDKAKSKVNTLFGESVKNTANSI